MVLLRVFMTREEWERLGQIGCLMCAIALRLRIGKILQFATQDREVVRRVFLLAKVLGRSSVTTTARAESRFIRRASSAGLHARMTSRLLAAFGPSRVPPRLAEHATASGNAILRKRRA
jgi:hypothetical protein